MWSDNITIIISVVALLVPAINLLLSTCIKHIQELQNQTLELSKINMNLKNMKFELDVKNIMDLKINSIDIYLNMISTTLNEIYPQNTFTVSIKLVSKSNTENPLESEVITLASYPNNIDNIKPIYKIKNNTDLSTIVRDKNEYFFVSDLKEYSVLNSYINENRHYIGNYNTNIVCPIQKSNKNSEDIIGFLCVDSPQKLNDVKKNKKIMDIIKSTASLVYEYLTENKLQQEVISIKDS